MSAWKPLAWGDVSDLRYGKALRGYKDSDGSTQVFGTNGPIGYTFEEPLAKGPRPVVGRKGAYRGVHLAAGPFWVIDTAYWLEPKEGLDPVFAYYALLGVDINGMDSGSALPSLTREHFYRVPLAVPPLEEQERIAGVLGAFDNLIETNRRLARDLMSLMFEQYGVLARDQPLTTFGTVARLVRDQWKPGSEGPDLYLGLEHFATDGAGLSGIGSSSSVQSVSLRFARGDVLYGKLRPYFRKVARPGFDGLCSSEVWVLRAQEGYPQSLVHALAHSPRFSEVAMAGSGGTRMPRADWKQVSTLPVPDLGSSALSQVDLDGLEALWRTACELDDECHDLARQRDELLPLLMSGKVRVRDMESAVS